MPTGSPAGSSRLLTDLLTGLGSAPPAIAAPGVSARTRGVHLLPTARTDPPAPASARPGPSWSRAVAGVRVVGGPDVGATRPLAPGRHLVGRAELASVPVDDPSLEPHHAVLDVTASGVVVARQLTGRVPMTLDGVAHAGPIEVPEGAVLGLGATRLIVGPAPDVAVRRPADAVGPVHRPPRRRIAGPATPVFARPFDPPPDEAGADATLATAAAGLVVALAVATLLGQPAFALFAAMGASVSVAGWVVARAGRSRCRRRDRARAAAERDALRTAIRTHAARVREHHVVTHPEPSLGVVDATSERLWERRPDHGDAFAVVLGTGDVADPGLTALAASAEGAVADELERVAVLPAVGVPADLGGGPSVCVAVAGPGAAAVARSIVVQLAVRTGPADWALVVDVDDHGSWGWAKALPHARGDVSPARVVIVTDRADGLRDASSHVRRRLDGDGAVTVVAVLDDAATVPAACRSILEIGADGRGRWTADVDAGELPVRLHVAGVTAQTAAQVARLIADRTDPESRAGGATLARSVGLGDVGLVADPVAIAARWERAGADPDPRAVVGWADDGPFEFDLVRDGPHALVAGTTGSGKSELLRTLVVALAATSPPSHLTFVLVDFKGGAAFDGLAALPHVVGSVTDLDAGLAERALAALDAEVRRRERVLRDAGAASLTAHRCLTGVAPLARLVVVVDEFAALASQVPELLHALVAVAQRGRSLGVHLVLATQRPAGAVSDDVRANTDLRIALRLQDAADSVDVVGDASAAAIGRDVPGRAVVRTGPGRPQLVQVAGPGAGGPPLADVVAAIRHATELLALAPPPPPWTEPLPSHLSPPDAGGAVGIVDDVAGQQRVPLLWDPAAGHLVLVGALGSGTTTALRSVLAARASVRGPDALHVAVVDAKGAPRLADLAALPHAMGVVRLHETERLDRLLRRVGRELDDRRGAPDAVRDRPEVLLAVDGLGTLRAALLDRDPTGGIAVLDAVLADGAALGVHLVATADATTSVGWVSRFPQRWVFHLDDPADGPTVGVRATSVPPAVPGRIVIASSGLAAQLAVVDPHASGPTEARPPQIHVLPARVAFDELTLSGAAGHLTVGRCFDDLGPATLRTHPGEHVLVLGPPGSGRTSALDVIVRAWRAVHGDGIVRFGPTIGDLPDADDRPVLVVIDDADRVDDPDGALLDLIERRRGAVTVVAAARPDVLRAAYGHWLHAVRRGGVGIVLAAEHDGDLLGVTLPRRPPIPPRPGLAWLVDRRGLTLAQLAMTS